MFFGLIIAGLSILGNVQCFRLSSTSPTLSALRLRNFHLKRQDLMCVVKGSSAVIRPRKPTLERISESLRAAGGEVKLSLTLFLKSSMEKKFLIMAYPLTIILLYLLFTSTLVTVQINRMIASFSNLVNSMNISIRKTEQNVSVLNKSFAKAKVEDINLVDKNIILESQLKEEEESNRIASDASMAQARKDIEAKLQFIIQAEEKVKQMKEKEKEVEAHQLSIAASVLVRPATIIPLTSSEEAIYVDEQKQSSVIYIEKDPQDLPLQETLLNLPSIAITSTTTTLSSADATVAMLFILAVSSPVLQIIHQFMISA